MQSQRQYLIHLLCGGVPLSELLKTDRLKNEEFDFDLTDQLLPTGHALFDGDSQPNFPLFVDSMVRRKHWSDAILFASVFLDETSKAKIFRMYLRQFYQCKSPMYSLLLVLTGNTDQSDWFADEHNWLLENWHLQVAFILASVNQLPLHNSKIRAFFETLAD
jgi:hypothetical protein